MRIVHIILVVFLSVGSAYAGQTAWPIGPKGLGPIEIGMPIDKALELSRVYTVTEAAKMAEGSKSMVYEVRQGANLLFVIEPNRKTVWRLDVRSADFRTAGGAGVGITLGQLKKFYPTMRVQGAEGGACGILMTQPVGYSFCFKGANPNPSSVVDHVLIFSTSG